MLNRIYVDLVPTYCAVISLTFRAENGTQVVPPWRMLTQILVFHAFSS